MKTANNYKGPKIKTPMMQLRTWVNSLPSLKRRSDDNRKILAPIKMTYEECQVFLPLKQNDVVYVIRCYDGDSATLGWIDRTGAKVRLGCRLRGYDTAEIRGSSVYVKELAVKAKKRLEDAIVGQFVTIVNPGIDKYGRILCDLRTDKIQSISAYMLAGGPHIARPYFGGKKDDWCATPKMPFQSQRSCDSHTE